MYPTSPKVQNATAADMHNSTPQQSYADIQAELDDMMFAHQANGTFIPNMPDFSQMFTTPTTYTPVASTTQLPTPPDTASPHYSNYSSPQMFSQPAYSPAHADTSFATPQTTPSLHNNAPAQQPSSIASSGVINPQQYAQTQANMEAECASMQQQRQQMLRQRYLVQQQQQQMLAAQNFSAVTPSHQQTPQVSNAQYSAPKPPSVQEAQRMPQSGNGCINPQLLAQSPQGATSTPAQFAVAPVAGMKRTAQQSVEAPAAKRARFVAQEKGTPKRNFAYLCQQFLPTTAPAQAVPQSAIQSPQAPTNIFTPVTVASVAGVKRAAEQSEEPTAKRARFVAEEKVGPKTGRSSPHKRQNATASGTAPNLLYQYPKTNQRKTSTVHQAGATAQFSAIFAVSKPQQAALADMAPKRQDSGFAAPPSSSKEPQVTAAQQQPVTPLPKAVASVDLTTEDDEVQIVNQPTTAQILGKFLPQAQSQTWTTGAHQRTPPVHQNPPAPVQNPNKPRPQPQSQTWTPSAHQRTPPVHQNPPASIQSLNKPQPQHQAQTWTPGAHQRSPPVHQNTTPQVQQRATTVRPYTPSAHQRAPSANARTPATHFAQAQHTTLPNNAFVSMIQNVTNKSKGAGANIKQHQERKKQEDLAAVPLRSEILLQGPLTLEQNNKALVEAVKDEMKRHGSVVGSNPELNVAAREVFLLQQRRKWTERCMVAGGEWMEAEKVMKSALAYTGRY